MDTKGKKAVGWQGLEPSTHKMIVPTEHPDSPDNLLLRLKESIRQRLKARLKTESKARKSVTNRHQ